jgi:hypothetical protein
MQNSDVVQAEAPEFHKQQQSAGVDPDQLACEPIRDLQATVSGLHAASMLWFLSRARQQQEPSCRAPVTAGPSLAAALQAHTPLAVVSIS